MPITKEGESCVVHFGHGDLALCHAKKQGMEYSDEISLFQVDGEHETGAFIDDQLWAPYAGKNSDELGVPVRLAFDNMAGLDSFLLTLLELREKMRKKSEFPAIFKDPRKIGVPVRMEANLRSLADSEHPELAALAKDAMAR